MKRIMKSCILKAPIIAPTGPPMKKPPTAPVTGYMALVIGS